MVTLVWCPPVSQSRHLMLHCGMLGWATRKLESLQTNQQELSHFITHITTHITACRHPKDDVRLSLPLSLSPDIIVNPVPSLDCQWNCNKNPPESSPPLLTIGHFVRSNWLVLSPCPGQVGLWEGGREEPTLCMASLAWPGLVFLFTKITFRSGRE